MATGTAGFLFQDCPWSHHHKTIFWRFKSPSLRPEIKSQTSALRVSGPSIKWSLPASFSHHALILHSCLHKTSVSPSTMWGSEILLWHQSPCLGTFFSVVQRNWVLCHWAEYCSWQGSRSARKTPWDNEADIYFWWFRHCKKKSFIKSWWYLNCVWNLKVLCGPSISTEVKKVDGGCTDL